MTASNTDPLIGRLVDGRYQVRSRIARGGMATVYLATDLRLDRRVAIKVMHSHLTDDVAFRDRFIQEARSAARLAHPNVVNVFDQGQDEDMAYLVMEYLPGITLRDLLNDHHALTSEQTLDIMQAVLSGLAAAHRSGIVHRDLKPENVLLADDGRIKIGDFGLARAASAATATGQALLGTVAYLSPELVTRGVADTRSDLYAMGIMMYEMLTGEQPFKGDQPMQIAYQHANESVPAPSGLKPDVPAELDEIVLWSTSRDPEKRPKDAGVMLEEVRQAALAYAPLAGATRVLDNTMVLTGAGDPRTSAQTQLIGTGPAPRNEEKSPTATGELRKRADGRRRRGGWLLALVVLLVAAAAGTGWYFGSGPGSKLTVIDVSEITAQEARTELTAAGFIVAADDVREPHRSIPEGTVIRTDPESGTSIDRATPVTLVVSSGPREIIVPDVHNLPLEEATTLLEDTGLVLQETIKQFDATVPAGNAIGLLDEDGAAMAAESPSLDGTPVILIESVGVVPDVRNMTVAEARDALYAVGLEITPNPSEHSDDVEADRIISATAPGDPVRPGMTIAVTVSLGPEMITVPGDLVGRTIAEAKAILEAAGFTVNVVTELPQSLWGNPFATVESVDPDEGVRVRKTGATVTVTGSV